MTQLKVVLGRHGIGHYSKLSGFSSHLPDTEILRLFEICDPIEVAGANEEGVPCSAISKPNLPILDYAEISDTITLTNAGVAGSVEVFINLDHTYPADLIITLEKGISSTAVLFEEEHTNGDEFIRRMFVTNEFVGEPVAGDWTLYIEDLWGGDEGVLNSWSMLINANGA